MCPCQSSWVLIIRLSRLTHVRRAQLSNNEILQGLVMPAASYVLLGKGGAVLVIVICFMAVTSSGASEMVAVSSLFTFDIYRKYIHPKVRPAGCVIVIALEQCPVGQHAGI